MGACASTSNRLPGLDRPTIGVEWEFAPRRPRDARPVQHGGRPLRRREPRLADPSRLHKELLRNTVEVVTGICGSVAEAVADLRSTLGGGRPRRGRARGRPARLGHAPVRELVGAAADRGRPLRGADQPHAVVGPPDADLGRARARRAARARPGDARCCRRCSTPTRTCSPCRPARRCGRGWTPAMPPTGRRCSSSCRPPDCRSRSTRGRSSRPASPTRPRPASSTRCPTCAGTSGPRPHLGTIENRVCDGMSDINELAALTALIHCLVVDLDTRLAAGETLPTMPPWHVQENKWRAARYGLDAIVILDETSRERLVTDDLDDLLERLTPVARRLDCENELRSVADIPRRGASYQRQRAVAAATRRRPRRRRRLGRRGAPRLALSRAQVRGGGIASVDSSCPIPVSISRSVTTARSCASITSTDSDVRARQLGGRHRRPRSGPAARPRAIRSRVQLVGDEVDRGGELAGHERIAGRHDLATVRRQCDVPRRGPACSAATGPAARPARPSVAARSCAAPGTATTRPRRAPRRRRCAARR